MSAAVFFEELITSWNTHHLQRLLNRYHPDFAGEDLTAAKNADQ